MGAKVLPIGGILWADKGKIHKNGRVTVPWPIRPIGGYVQIHMVEIPPVPQKFVDRPLQDIYPYFWVDENDLIDAPIEEPVPPATGAVTEVEAFAAFKTLMKFIRSL